MDGGKERGGGRKKVVKKKKKKKKAAVNTLCLYPDGICLKGGRALVEGRRKKEGAKYRVKITSLRGCRNGERERRESLDKNFLRLSRSFLIKASEINAR